MPLKDKDAKRAYHREYMKRYLVDPTRKAKHLARISKNSTKYKEIAKAVVREWKRNGCSICGELREVCLDAHHLDPKTKENDIGQMVSQRNSVDSIKEELDKCICVCKNCHAVIHSRVEKSGISLGS